MYIRNDSIIAYLFWIYGLFSVSSLNICEVGSVQFQLNTIPTIIKQLYWCSVQLYDNFLIRHLSAASMREQQYSSVIVRWWLRHGGQLFHLIEKCEECICN